MNNLYYDYLTHHGILGQKWGVRRYQNPDGSLTSAGKKRLAKREDAVVRGIVELNNLKINAQYSNPSSKELDDYLAGIDEVIKELQGKWDENGVFNCSVEELIVDGKHEAKGKAKTALYLTTIGLLSVGGAVLGGITAN